MPKELTLDELANSAVSRKKEIIHESPAAGAVPMNSAQVAEQLTAAGRMKPKEEKVVDAPVVDSAFKSMAATIEERKERINQAIPYIYDNAREIALDNQLGESDSTEDTDDITTPVAQYDNYDNDADTINDEETDNMVENFSASENNQDISAYDFDGPPDNFYTSQPPIVDLEQPKKEDPSVIEATTNSNTFNDDSSAEYYTKDDALENLMRDLEEEDDELTVEDDEGEDPQETRERLKKTLQNVQIISNPIDFNKFEIRRTAVSSNVILNNIQSQTTRMLKRADWALYHSKRAFTFVECTGPELDSLRKTITNSNNINAVIKSLQFIYNHIEDGNKPSFEAWCKLIRTEDVESLYYGLYRACYAHSNLIGRVCEVDRCKKTSLIDTDINAMVVYGGENDNHEEIKQEFQKILAKDTTTATNVTKSQLLQISDNIVISYSPATLYTTFVQFSVLKQEIADKNNELLNTLAYIDGFFSINRESNQLVPIAIKEYPNNFNRTVTNRLNVYLGILKSLTNDQYNVLMATLANVIQAPKINYVYPKVKCPECGAEIPEAPVESMLNLLFTRAQLAQIRSL